MLDNVWKWLAYFAVICVILFVGWKQPLSYRFMSEEQIYAIEHPAKPVPVVPGAPPAQIVVVTATPTPIPWMWDPNRKTTLDRAPYNQNSTNYSGRGLYPGTPYPTYTR